MPKLPLQRGFYDDIRGFQRKDVKVRTEAFAPTRAQQIRRQIAWGLAALALLGGAAACHIILSAKEAKEVPKASSMWKGVSVKAAGAPTEPSGHH